MLEIFRCGVPELGVADQWTSHYTGPVSAFATTILGLAAHGARQGEAVI